MDRRRRSADAGRSRHARRSRQLHRAPAGPPQLAAHGVPRRARRFHQAQPLGDPGRDNPRSGLSLAAAARDLARLVRRFRGGVSRPNANRGWWRLHRSSDVATALPLVWRSVPPDEVSAAIQIPVGRDRAELIAGSRGRSNDLSGLGHDLDHQRDFAIRLRRDLLQHVSGCRGVSRGRRRRHDVRVAQVRVSRPIGKGIGEHSAFSIRPADSGESP